MAECEIKAAVKHDGPVNGCRVRFQAGETSRNRLWMVLMAFVVGMVATAVTMAETKASRSEVESARQEQKALLMEISAKVGSISERLVSLETTIKERDRVAAKQPRGGV